MTGRWMTCANIAQARRLWDAGLSTSEIARRIGHGCTKDAIVGCAHRRNWPPRPSPIARDGQRATEAVPRIGPQPHKRGGELTRMPPGEAKRRSSPREIVERVACRPLVLAVPTPRFSGCQWLEGDDRRTWKACGAPIHRQSPYCEAHFLRCYLKPGQKAWMLEAA